MPSTRVQDMTAAGALTGTELFYSDTGAGDRKVTADQIKAFSDHSFFDQIIDVSDYGTLTDGADITAIVQAAIDAADASNIGGIIYIPAKDGATSHEVGALTWPTQNNIKWQLWLAVDIEMIDGATLELPEGSVIRGFPHTFNIPQFQHEPVGPSISGGTSDPVVRLCEHGLIENLRIDGFDGVGLEIKPQDSGVHALGTVRNVQIVCDTNDAAQVGLVIDTCFWFNIEDVTIHAEETTGYAIKIISTVTPSSNGYVGLLKFKNLKLAGGCIQIAPLEVHAANLVFEDLLHENMESGRSLFEIDTTDNTVSVLRAIRCELADAPSDSYYIKHTGGAAGACWDVWFEDRRNDFLGFVHPDSAEIFNLRDEAYSGSIIGRHYDPVDPAYTQSYAQYYPEFIDVPNLCAPLAPQWTLGTPLAVPQLATSWDAFCSGTATVTAGQLGPDGSTNAGLYSGASGENCEIYDVATSLNVDDWIIVGCWHFSVTGGFYPVLRLSDWSVSSAGAEFNGQTPSVSGFGFPVFSHRRHIDNSWVWLCQAFKVTGIGTGTCRIRLFVGTSVSPNASNSAYIFNPCLQYIPASAGHSDYYVANYARSLRGGWSSNAKQGEVSILDHQKFRSGTALMLTDGVTAPSTVSGAAQIYVDTADGDLKVKFGDGTIKTIVVDT